MNKLKKPTQTYTWKWEEMQYSWKSGLRKGKERNTVQGFRRYWDE